MKRIAAILLLVLVAGCPKHQSPAIGPLRHVLYTAQPLLCPEVAVPHVHLIAGRIDQLTLLRIVGEVLDLEVLGLADRLLPVDRSLVALRCLEGRISLPEPRVREIGIDPLFHHHPHVRFAVISVVRDQDRLSEDIVLLTDRGEVLPVPSIIGRSK